MIVYTSTRQGFLADVRERDIDAVVASAYGARTGRTVGPGEFRAWRDSLREMALVLDDDEMPAGAGVAIEYHLPQTSRRIDFIVTGRGAAERSHAIVIELKQWSRSRPSDTPDLVFAHRGGRAFDSEGPHPSYQAWSYASMLASFNEEVHGHDDVDLHPCAYLHNHPRDGSLDDGRYAPLLERAPIFLKGAPERERLRRFIRQHVRKGDDGALLYRLEHGRIRPSRMLADAVVSMLAGHPEFVLLDEQKTAYETILRRAEAAHQTGAKQVVIVHGGPGTGKSVLALHLLVALTARERNARYVSKNAAPRAVYEQRLTAGRWRRTAVQNLFVGSGAFMQTEADTFDALLVDEAHRLQAGSGLYGNQGENQVKELIRSARTSVFFVDDHQRVTLQDVGQAQAIRDWAAAAGIEPVELTLSSQFRCGGSDGYLAWIDDALGLRETAHPLLGRDDYDFRIFDSPVALHEAIEEANRERNRARVVAGYCWNWASKKDPAAIDIAIAPFGYARQWNLPRDGSLWIETEGSVDQVGCVYTCQGLELDVVGVIIGPDLVVRDGALQTEPGARARSDQSLKGWKSRLKTDAAGTLAEVDQIIRNTYRTLMTRGMKACWIYCVDPNVAACFRARLAPVAHAPARSAATAVVDARPPAVAPVHDAAVSARSSPSTSQPVHVQRPSLPWPMIVRFDADGRPDHPRAIPVVPLQIAAGRFSSTQTMDEGATGWVELPEDFSLQPGLFVAQVTGRSMNRRIPDGAWCLFRAWPQGTRDRKIVLAMHRRIDDPETGGGYTIKRYRSVKEMAPDDMGGWRHQSIRLEPDSDDPAFEPMVFGPDEADGLAIVAELIAVLDD